MKKVGFWNWICGLIFLVFFVFLIRQFMNVFIYYDDFGYLSLSYGGALPDVTGSEYDLRQLMTFLVRHYTITHGRLPFVFLFLLLYMLGGLRAVQVFLAASVLLTGVLSFAIAVRAGGLTGWLKCPAAAFACLLYGTIGIMIQRSGTYWFSASFLYAAPVPVFLSFAALYTRLADRQLAAASARADAPRPRYGRLLSAVLLLGFLSAFSHEQWTAAVIACILMVIGYKLKKGGRFQLTDAAVIAAAAAGAFPIFSSPAVRSRMAHNQAYMEMSLAEKIFSNLRNIGNMFFSGENINYLLILLLAFGCMGLLLIRLHRKMAWLHAFYILFTGSVLCYLIIKLKLHLLGAAAHSTVMLVCLYLYLLASACEILLLFYLKDRFLPAVLFAAAVASMGCLVLAPELPLRTMLPFLFLSCSFLTCLFAAAELQWKPACVPALLVLAAVSLPNMRQIYHGYAANYAVHMYNEARIREAAAQKGNAPETVSLYQNLDGLCCYEMVYDPNFSNIIRWMREYYDLPETVTLDYQIPAAGDVAAINAAGRQ